MPREGDVRLRLRSFLERNKIFFETIAASLLAMMAVILSGVQAYVATRQTALMTLQTRVAELQALPQIEVLGFAGDNGDASWEIYNRGAAVQELTLEPTCFVFIDKRVGGTLGPVERIPVDGCIGSSWSTWGGTGKLAGIGGFHKTTAITGIEHQLVQQYGRNVHGVWAHVEIVAHLKYEDALGRRHENYYTASTFNGCHAIPPADGAALVATWNTRRHDQLSDLNPQHELRLIPSR